MKPKLIYKSNDDIVREKPKLTYKSNDNIVKVKPKLTYESNDNDDDVGVEIPGLFLATGGVLHQRVDYFADEGSPTQQKTDDN